MKVCLLYVGLATQSFRKHQLSSKSKLKMTYATNFSNSVPNHLKFLHQSFENLSVYCSIGTEEPGDLKEFQKVYSGTNSSCIHMNTTHKKEKVLKGFELLPNECEFVIITRPDIEFKFKVFDFLNFTSFNLVSRLKEGWAIDDNFYAFPVKFRKTFEANYKKLPTRFPLYHTVRLLDNMTIHFMKNEQKPVRDLSFFKIVRIIQ